ncbi:MAG: CAAX prenyl protease-related protein [Gemmatimonadota bacterium]
MQHRPGLTRTLPFAIFIGIMALDPLLQGIFPPGFDGRWSYGIRTTLALLALAVLWRNYGELRSLRGLGWKDWLLGLSVGILLFIFWINLDFPQLSLGSGTGFDPRTEEGFALGLVVTRLAGAAIVVPVMEELFWRSFVLRWLHNSRFLTVAPNVIEIRPLLISSVLFATEHHLWFAGLLAGLGYGLVYKRSGNLWVPIFAHAVTNGLLGAYVLMTGEWGFW